MAKQVKTTCSVCGSLRSSALLGRDICQSCWRREKNGEDYCSSCKEIKVIFNKVAKLCKSCYKESKAKNSFKTLVKSFSTSYPYNNYLFRLLVSTIDINNVSERINRRFREFGRFLQSHELSQPLTWEGIEKNLPDLNIGSRYNAKLIRSCLLELGHILAAAGKLEKREVYLKKRNILEKIKESNPAVRLQLESFTGWLWGKQHTLANVQDYIEVLKAFWLWCEVRRIMSPEQVQPLVITEYLIALKYQWQCPTCGANSYLERPNQDPPSHCEKCGVKQPLQRVKRYAQNTVRQHRAKLFVFFEWLKNSRRTLINPVQQFTLKPEPKIEHYPSEVIQQLCHYLRQPETDPNEALVLYLILFHALSVRELRYAQLPHAHAIRCDVSIPSVADTYYLVLPEQEVSIGKRSPGRPETRINFPVGAASWLKPLLDRYEAQRKQVLQGWRNQHLLVHGRSVRHNKPVSHGTVWRLVQRASLNALGAACDANTLRKTAGIMFADRGGGAILQWLGWEAQQAFGYTWMSRQVKYPRQLGGVSETLSEVDGEAFKFPSRAEVES